MVKVFGAPLEIKELDERGSFEGLAAVYGNVDLGGDVIVPGAFKEFDVTRDGSIRLLDGHNTRAPIGKGKVTDTHLGLAIKGRLSLEVARAREVHALMKDGIVDGLSIGYDVLGGLGTGYDLDETGVRRLKALKVWEVSTTPFPMNQAALIAQVKQAGVERVTSIKECEDLLRDAVGLSRSQAKKFAGDIWKSANRREVDEGQRDAEISSVLESMQLFLKSL